MGERNSIKRGGVWKQKRVILLRTHRKKTSPPVQQKIADEKVWTESFTRNPSFRRIGTGDGEGKGVHLGKSRSARRKTVSGKKDQNIVKREGRTMPWGKSG